MFTVFFVCGYIYVTCTSVGLDLRTYPSAKSSLICPLTKIKSCVCVYNLYILYVKPTYDYINLSRSES